MEQIREYRECVVGVIMNSHGFVLVGERSDYPGSWQLPQGGVDAGEKPESAVFREMQEELGIGKFQIIKQSSQAVSYDFPEDLATGIAQKYRGQKQIWFLLNPEFSIDPKTLVGDGEFMAFKWSAIIDIVDHVIEWKKECYKAGFSSLGLGV